MSKLKIGITGQDGFLGRHLMNYFSRTGHFNLIPFERTYFQNSEKLEMFIQNCDAVVHCAGINRGSPDDVYSENIRLGIVLENCLRKKIGPIRLIFASSTQESGNSPYGKAKNELKNRFENWATETGNSAVTIIIPNVFGPFSKPFYNSVVATFSHQLLNGEQPTIIEDREINLVYVERVSHTILKILNSETRSKIVLVPADHTLLVSKLFHTLREYYDIYIERMTFPEFKDQFEVDLFNTFRSYLPNDFFPKLYKLHADKRGHLFEVVRSLGRGQSFISTTRPGIIRGNHYHTRKIERFSVLSGSAIVRWRPWGSSKICEFRLLGGGKASFIDIPVLHSHNIENIGTTELVTLFWSNEIFDPNDSDTYSEKV